MVRRELICLYIYSLIFIIVAARTTIGHFKVSHRSPEIKECAKKVLHTEESTGLLVFKTPDDCEVMVGHWNEEKLKPGQGYAKLLGKNIVYQPPVELRSAESHTLNITGMLNSMSRLDVYVTWPEKNTAWDIKFTLKGKSSNNEMNSIWFRIYDAGRVVTVGEMLNANKDYSTYFDDQLNGSKCKISLAINTISYVKLEINDVMVFARKTEYFPVEGIYELEVYLDEQETEVLKINRVELSDKK